MQHVMFSIHSSFSELVSFVNSLSPKNVTPITSIERAGFAKLVELTRTNVLYLNDKTKDSSRLSTSSEMKPVNKILHPVSNNNNSTIPQPPPLPPSKINNGAELPKAAKWKNWNTIKPRAPKKAKIEPIFSQSGTNTLCLSTNY